MADISRPADARKHVPPISIQFIFYFILNLFSSLPQFITHPSATCQGGAEDNVPEHIEWAKTYSSFFHNFQPVEGRLHASILPYSSNFQPVEVRLIFNRYRYCDLFGETELR